MSENEEELGFLEEKPGKPMKKYKKDYVKYPDGSVGRPEETVRVYDLPSGVSFQDYMKEKVEELEKADPLGQHKPVAPPNPLDNPYAHPHDTLEDAKRKFPGPPVPDRSYSQLAQDNAEKICVEHGLRDCPYDKPLPPSVSEFDAQMEQAQAYAERAAAEHSISHAYAVARGEEAKTLNDYAVECRIANDTWWRDPVTGKYLVDEGWPRNKGELMMLMVTEISEAFEGARKDLMDDHLPHRKAEEVELVDALIRIFDYAGEHNLDLEGAYQEKMQYNAKRADHKPASRLGDHGKKW